MPFSVAAAISASSDICHAGVGRSSFRHSKQYDRGSTASSSRVLITAVFNLSFPFSLSNFVSIGLPNQCRAMSHIVTGSGPNKSNPLSPGNRTSLRVGTPYLRILSVDSIICTNTAHALLSPAFYLPGWRPTPLSCPLRCFVPSRPSKRGVRTASVNNPSLLFNPVRASPLSFFIYPPKYKPNTNNHHCNPYGYTGCVASACDYCGCELVSHF